MDAALAFVFASVTSPQGCVVGALFALLIWTHVGIQTLRNRAAERAHLAELNGLLAEMPATRPEKTLYRPQLKEPHRAA